MRLRSEIAGSYAFEGSAKLRESSEKRLGIFGRAIDPDVEILCVPRLAVDHHGVTAYDRLPDVRCAWPRTNRSITTRSLGTSASYLSIPNSSATRTNVCTSRSTCFSVCAAVHEMRNRFCAAAGRSTGLI